MISEQTYGYNTNSLIIKYPKLFQLLSGTRLKTQLVLFRSPIVAHKTYLFVFVSNIYLGEYADSFTSFSFR